MLFLAILILSVVPLAAGCCDAVPLPPAPAYADSRPLTAEISTNATSPTFLHTIHFNLTFNKPVNASTLDVSDISATSGTVQNLRTEIIPQRKLRQPGNGRQPV